MRKTPLEWALYWASLGFRVLPCRPSPSEGKRAKSPLTLNGEHDATTNPSQIQQWWERWPDALIGIRPRAGELVLDCEAPDSHGPGSPDGVAILCQYPELQRAAHRMHFTPTGGVHLFLRYDPALGLTKREGILPGVDFRASVGYVIAPGSRRLDVPGSGEYIEAQADDNKCEPTPAWLLEKLLPAKHETQSAWEEYENRVPTEGEKAHAQHILAKQLKTLREWPVDRSGAEALQKCAWSIAGLWALREDREKHIEEIRHIIYEEWERSWQDVARAENLLEGAFTKAPPITLDPEDPELESLQEAISRALSGQPANDSSASGSRLWTPAEIYAPITDPAYTIPGLRISAGRPTLLIGPPGCGKSYALADLLHALGTGETIWHRFAPMPSGPVPVLHLDWEQGSSQVRRRAQEIALGRKTQPQGYFYMRPDWYLNKPEGFEALVKLLAETRARACALDCLRAANPGVEENDSRFAEPLRTLGKVAEQMHVEFFVIHHSGKHSTSARGTSDIEASAGEIFAFTKEEDGRRLIRHTRTQSEPAFEGDLELRQERKREGLQLNENDPVPTLITAADSVVSLEDRVKRTSEHEQYLLNRVVSAVATYERTGVKCNLRVLSDAVGIPLTEAKRVLAQCLSRRLVFQHGTNDDPDIRTKPVEEIPHFHGTDLPRVIVRNPLTP